MRIASITFISVFLIGAANAQPATATPDECSAAADAPAYASEGIDADDLNPWRSVSEEIAPVVDRTIADHPRADRIFLRLRADPETGQALAPPERACGE